MKPYIVILTFFITISQFLTAQDSGLLKRISFRIAITHTSMSESKGWLANIGDSSVLLANRSVHFANARTAAAALKEIDYAGMSKITVKRNNGAGRGALLGAISGLVIGAAAGLIDGDDPVVPASQDYFGIANAFRMTAGEKAVAGGFGGGALGAGIGALIGAFMKKTFIIGGKKEQFDKMRINVLSKAYRNN